MNTNELRALIKPYTRRARHKRKLRLRLRLMMKGLIPR